MRFLNLFIGVLVLASCQSKTEHTNTVTSSSDKKEDIIAIGNVLDTQVHAWNLGNVREFMKGYWHSDSLRFINKKGINSGYDSVEARYLRHYNTPEKMGVLSFKNLEFTALDPLQSVYNVTGNWKISGKDSTGGFFSLIFRKEQSNWKIIADHTW
jgi:hypothetical protein